MLSGSLLPQVSQWERWTACLDSLLKYRTGEFFRATAELFDTFDDKLPIATKSEEEIDKFLVEHEHIVNAFKSVCLAQIRAQLD